MRPWESDGKSLTAGVEIAAEGTWRQYESAVDGFKSNEVWLWLSLIAFNLGKTLAAAGAAEED
jgi:hypothetical protein